jgi:hypothetical protein
MGAENFSPEISEINDNSLPVCPHYGFIKDCAELADIEITSGTFFCGTSERHEDTISVLSGFEGTIYEPESDCSKVYIKLMNDFHKANQRVEVPDEKQLREDIENTSLGQLRIRLNEWYELKTQKEERDGIISRWRQIIWNR